MSTEIHVCHFCGGVNTRVDGDAVALWITCPRCFARGPAVLRARPDAEAQVRAAWEAGRKFGKIGVAKVPNGMPSYTCSLAERLRLVAESIYAGEYGEAEAGVLIMRSGGHATVVTHNLSNADVTRVLASVLEASRLRGDTVPLLNKNPS